MHVSGWAGNHSAQNGGKHGKLRAARPAELAAHSNRPAPTHDSAHALEIWEFIFFGAPNHSVPALSHNGPVEWNGAARGSRCEPP